MDRVKIFFRFRSLIDVICDIIITWVQVSLLATRTKCGSMPWLNWEPHAYMGLESVQTLSLFVIHECVKKSISGSNPFLSFLGMRKKNEEHACSEPEEDNSLSFLAKVVIGR